MSSSRTIQAYRGCSKGRLPQYKRIVYILGRRNGKKSSLACLAVYHVMPLTLTIIYSMRAQAPVVSSMFHAPAACADAL